MAPRIAVIIPCFNEELTVKKVVSDFKRELPTSAIYVFDNCSSDNTAKFAAEAGATVIPAPIPGKGATVRQAFGSVEADIYVMVDGDDTYPAEQVHEMISKVTQGFDMVCGDRLSNGRYKGENQRPFHTFGNACIVSMISWVLRRKINDVLTGYRAMSRRFVKNCPLLLDKFEVETEMTIHAVEKKFRMIEIPIEYRDRPKGSYSKLNTMTDGMLVMRAIIWLVKDCKPLWFFGSLGIIGIVVATLGIFQADSSLVPLFWMLFIIASAILGCGLVLDTVTKQNLQTFAISMIHQGDTGSPPESGPGVGVGDGK